MNPKKTISDYLASTSIVASRCRKICKIFNKSYSKTHILPVGEFSSNKASKIIEELIKEYKK